MKVRISLIAAVASGNRGIGKNNRLIFHIPEDLKRFKKITSHHVVIMGRKTFEAIGHPLPNRTNIIITRDPQYFVEGAIVAHSVDEALKIAHEKEKEEIFVIGGGQIYQETITLADKLYLTIVEGLPEADTFFPDYSDFKKVVFEESHQKDGLKYKYLNLER